MTKQIFEGLKVVDFSWAAAGPQVCRELAEHGATVIRVESHGRPCPLRTFAPHKDAQPGIDRSAFYTAYNTNKLNMSIDLTHPKAKESIKRLIEWADVTGESMTVGTMAKMGLDYESCRKLNPGIIYFSTTQQGANGPNSNFRGVGHHINALGGFCRCTGWPESEPTMIFTAYSDYVAPWYIIVAIIGALLRRRKTGQGMYIEQAQLEAGLTFAAPHILDFMVNGRNAERRGNRDSYMAPHGIYPCAGADRWVAIAVANKDQWASFCKIIDNPTWTEDIKFSSFKARKENEDELDRLVSEWTQGYTPEQVMEMMQKAVVPAGVVKTCEDLLNDPQMKHREHFRKLEHPEIGVHSYHAPAYRFSQTPCDIHRAGPLLGQDNEYIYRDILGFTDDEIADLLMEGVITTEASPLNPSW